MSERTDFSVRAEAGPLSGRRILVVDDEEDVRTYILTVLADAGAMVCEAADGIEAVEVARRERPDLITLDLSMPRQDGVETFCKLRTTSETEHTPICIVTGHPEFRCLIYERPAAPPEGYLDKPVEPDTLVRTVQRILDMRRRRQRGRS
jgi:CheY-like chemotaxis protein